MKCYVHLRYDTSDMPLFASLEYDENGVTRRTRARGPEDPLDFRYILKVYDDQDYRSRTSGTRGEFHEISLTVPVTGESPDRTFEVELPAGDYSILGWSDYVETGRTDDKYYTTDDMRSVTVIQDSRGNHPGGYEGRQCFRGDALVAVTLPDPVAYDEVTEPKTIELRRPFAQLNFATSDLEAAKKAGFEFGGSRVKVSNVYTKLNLLNGTASDGQEVTFAYAPKLWTITRGKS